VTYQFDDVCVDLDRLSITRNGVAVEVEPKAFDVLRHLLEHADRLVTKDELMDTVWRDTFVTPNVLTRAVAQLRRALADDAHEARYIETVAKRGYRFVAAVESGRRQQSVPVTPAAPAAPATRDRPASTLRAQLIAASVLVAAVGGVAVVARLPPRHALAPVPLPARVTVGAGTNTTPSISPDGRAVAFASDRTGSFEIYVVGLVPGSEEVAITSDGGQNMQPDWSPDGRWIAFHSRRRGGVWIVPSTGGTPRQIVEHGSNAAWSPDSERLVYTPAEGGLAGQQVLWTVRRDGSDRRQLTRLGQPAGGHANPVWSHNGRFIAFAVSNGVSNTAIWVADASSGNARLLAMSKGASHPQFGPDDRAVAWTGKAAGYTDAIFQIGFEASSGRAIGEAAIVMPFGNGLLEGLSIAHDGTAVFGAGSTDANLWAIELDGDGGVSEPARLTNDVVRNGRPDYSSDGRIAFSQFGPGRPISVWAMDGDGSHRVLVNDGPAGEPSWSSDGTRLLVKRNGDRSDGLWWVDMESRRATATGITDAAIRSTRPSPDSRSIAFHLIDADGAIDVWTQPLDGGARRRLTHDPEAASYPIWSPDGRSLAVEVKRGERTQIGVVAAEGGPIELLTDDPGQNWPHSWSPDGEHIAYAAERGGVWNIREISRRTHRSRELTHFSSSNGYVRYPSWSPRGSRIVFERETDAAAIWSVRLPTNVERRTTND
jgi:Tol biopolymer transport system component/DNA-binding winged helix-turn-helix (wHTH) protein